MVLIVKKIDSIVYLQYLEVLSLFFVPKSQLFHKPTKLFILRLIINKKNIALHNSILSLSFFFLNLNYLSIKNSTLNYASINLLCTKRVNHNLINSFVKKFSFSSRYMPKKNTFLILIQIQNRIKITTT